MSNRLSAERQTDLRRCLDAGMGDREITRLLSMAKNTVYAYRTAWGISAKRRGYRGADLGLVAIAPKLRDADARLTLARQRLAAAQQDVQEAEDARALIWAEHERLRARSLDEEMAARAEEGRCISEALRAHGNNVAAAAAQMGIGYATFRDRISRLGIDASRRKPFAHMGTSRRLAAKEAGVCVSCERQPATRGTKCLACAEVANARDRRLRVRRLRAGRCAMCGQPSGGTFRCADCAERHYVRRGDGSPREREPMIREWGTFLSEDMEQEKILAELEGRAFDQRDFYKRHAPRQELAIMDRPMGDGDGDTLHAVRGAPASGSPWMSPRVQGGVANPAEERMVRRLDREPTIDELRAEAETRPWQNYVHAVSLENAEEAVAAWLEFITWMTPDEFAEMNIEAQIEAIMPGLSMGEVLRCIRESLAWSERDLERRAQILPGNVRKLERGEVDYRSTPIRAIAGALSAVTELVPGRLQAHLSAAWGPVHKRTAPPVVIESQKDARRQRQAPLTQNLGPLLRQYGG